MWKKQKEQKQDFSKQGKMDKVHNKYTTEHLLWPKKK